MQVDEVKNIMVDNIEKVLERGEKIELLVDKTDNLRFQVHPVPVMSSARHTLITHSRELQQAPAGGTACIYMHGCCEAQSARGHHASLLEMQGRHIALLHPVYTCCMDADPIYLLGNDT